MFFQLNVFEHVKTCTDTMNIQLALLTTGAVSIADVHADTPFGGSIQFGHKSNGDEDLAE